MVTITVSCPHCGSEQSALNGRETNEKQKYRCKTCKKQSLENPTQHAWLPKNAEKRFSEPLKSEAVCEGSSGHSEYHGLKSNSWIKKAAQLPALPRNADAT